MDKPKIFEMLQILAIKNAEPTQWRDVLEKAKFEPAHVERMMSATIFELLDMLTLEQTAILMKTIQSV